MSAPVKKVPIHLQSSQNRLLIRNGRIVNDDGISENDVFIEDGTIKEIGKNLFIPGGTRTIDARGLFILPGGIDPHTHLDFEFMGAVTADDFYQGTKAAIAGGTTMIIDFVIPKKGESLIDAYHSYRQKADDKVCCDYGLHTAITSWNDKVKNEMEILCSKFGINSFKLFMAYSFRLNDSELYSAFEYIRKLGAIAQVHAENGSIIDKNTERLLEKGITGPEGHELSRPEEVEAEAVNRACVIAKQVNVPLYVTHVSSGPVGRVIAEKQTEGQIVYGEVLSSAIVHKGNCSNVTTITQPPHSNNDNEPSSELLGLIASGNLQVVSSDNCTFTKAQKELGKNDFSKIPNGVNGVEDRMSVVWEKGVYTGCISPSEFVAITSTNAARIFNLYPRKGCIAVGSDADLLIWNPNKTRVISAKTHHHAVDFNIFEGMECHGVPEFVLVNGRVCVDEGQLKVVQGYGRYIERPVFPPYVFHQLQNGSGCEKHLSELSITEQKQDINEHKPFKGSQEDNWEEQTPQTEFTANYALTPSCRGARPENSRNMQDSTFSLSAENETDVERRSCIRVNNPPGGKSSGFW